MCVGVRSRASCRTARVLSLANGRRYTGRAALNSTLMQLTTQVAIVKAAGCMQKSTEVRGPAACPRVGARARQGSRSSARVTLAAGDERDEPGDQAARDPGGDDEHEPRDAARGA